MKKILLLLFAAFLSLNLAAKGEQVVLVDMDYIMSAIPAYETANEQLEQISKKWQKEIEAILLEVQTMYKNYQTELVFLSDEMKKKREDEIIAKEKEANDLKRKYFAPDGELYKKREALVKPIQDEIYNAVQEICEQQGYQVVLDKSSTNNLIFASPKIDISDQLLEKLGYSK
ncbi:MAG: OmpH family outer membrane protein [Paludibacteraceae bacterium]|jgi:outer membrane protein|nr:OmpH family outer membrane protein [Paludibacteraceae bacterium]